MSNQRVCRNLKCLAVDGLMGAIFLLLMAFAAWLLWVYYIRGPVDLPVEQAMQEAAEHKLSRQEQYALKHFHNPDEVVIAGIQSGSPCLECHGDYPHSQANKDRRGFLNAHAWFAACEVCHLRQEDRQGVVYRWLANDTGEPLSVLADEPTRGGAMIVPLRMNGNGPLRLDQPVEAEMRALALLQGAETVGEVEKEAALERVHARISKPHIFCGDCHAEHGLLAFRSLLYDNRRARHLESIDMAAMIKSYEVFHLPGIFGPHE